MWFPSKKAESFRTDGLIQLFTEAGWCPKSICGCTLPLKMRNFALNRTRHCSGVSHVWIMGGCLVAERHEEFILHLLTLFPTKAGANHLSIFIYFL